MESIKVLADESNGRYTVCPECGGLFNTEHNRCESTSCTLGSINYQ